LLSRRAVEYSSDYVRDGNDRRVAIAPDVVDYERSSHGGSGIK
jgi:hypothetical protein